MWEQILQYLFLRKPDPNGKKNIDLTVMHGINRISIFIFLIGVIVMIIKLMMHR
jgi:hypothetical protein